MRLWLFLAAVNGGLSVVFGAFAAHLLKARLSAEALSLVETGARYQMYHALALLAVAWLAARSGSAGGLVGFAGGAFVFGIVVFCGALYALGLTGIRRFGLLAPVGGTALILGWIALAVAALRG